MGEASRRLLFPSGMRTGGNDMVCRDVLSSRTCLVMLILRARLAGMEDDAEGIAHPREGGGDIPCSTE